MNLILIAGGVIYLLASAALFAFGANFIYFSILAWRNGKPREEHTAPGSSLPRITVQLPIFNELYVSARIIEAACRLDYPNDLLQIQVLDDSTDETSAIVAESVGQARAQGTDIVHIRRRDRSGFKAGALREGLKSATGEFIAIFDADFVPEPDFLTRAITHFTSPDVAFVQGRWGHLNGDYSWVTRVQSLAIDAHFMVEQPARGLRGYWFNFNGTAGIWRRIAIEDAGGWTADTLTEDLDLSYRAHLKGWRGRYVGDLVAPAELPAHFAGFRRQQHRWARGSLECAIKLLPQVWRSDARPAIKAQASAHLLGYSVHLLLFALTLVYPLVVALSLEYARFSTLFGFAYLFAMTSLAPGIFFATGQRQLGRAWWRDLPRILVVTILGSGLMLNTVRAAAGIVGRRTAEFERTAKFGIRETTTSPTNWMKQRYQLRFDPIVFFELALGFYSLATAWLAFNAGTWGIMLYATLFGVGLLTVAVVTAAESIAVFRNRRGRAEQLRLERSQWAAAGAE